MAEFVSTSLPCDDFHLDAAQQLLALLQGKPQLLGVEIGNWSSYRADVA
jgi:hypothetical protein